MYIIPIIYNCITCKKEFKWSPHADLLGFNEPFCPYCFITFIKKNVSLGELKK